jgi:filamentous hemagglutinin family protein
MNNFWRLSSLILVILPLKAKAQIIPDASTGTQITPDININGILSDQINGGSIRGSNLFHSFSEFNINTGRGVYFSNPVDITNILTRVTGVNASNLNGKLGVLGNANLYFLNPNGIMFGQNASLDLNGSFVATTANGVKLANIVISRFVSYDLTIVISHAA